MFKIVTFVTSVVTASVQRWEMRRQSLRPRQIDIHSRLLVVRSEEDLVVEDESGSTLPIATLDELSAMVDDTPQKPKRKKNIPIPVVVQVENYKREVSNDFEIPSSYVRFQNIPQDDEEDKVEIDVEKEDMDWLIRHPKFGENGDPRYQLSLDKFESMLDILEKASGMIHPNLVSLGEAEELFSKKLNLHRTPQNKVTIDIYNYWVQRRQKLKKPLLRRFWPPTPCSDTNPHLVFRPREKERYKLRKHRKNEMEGFKKMQQLKVDFDRVRNLMDFVRKREKAKRLLVDVLDEILKQTIYDLTDKSGKPRKLKLEDFDRRFNTSNLTSEDERARKRSKKKSKKKKKEASGADPHHNRVNIFVEKMEDDPFSDRSKRSSSMDSSETLHVPTFMTYIPSFVSSIDLQSKTPSYNEYIKQPSFDPPRYQCRGRYGRGGRLIIDRIPFQSSTIYKHPEVYAQPSLFDLDYVTSFSLESNSSGTLTSNSSGQQHQQVLPEETIGITCPSISIPYQKLQDIYSMSDSEDEFLESVVHQELFGTDQPTKNSETIVKYKLEI